MTIKSDQYRIQICLIKFKLEGFIGPNSFFSMATFAVLRLFTQQKDTIRSYVAWIIDNPVIFCRKFHTFWLYPTLKSKSVISSIELETFSVFFCCFNKRTTINSSSYLSLGFHAFIILISLRPSLNKTIFHNIRNYLVHFFIIIDSNTMISNIPLAIIIILSQPFSMRFRIFPNNFKTNTEPIV